MTLTDYLRAASAAATAAELAMTGPAKSVASVVAAALSVAVQLAEDGRSPQEIVDSITRIRPVRQYPIDSEIDGALRRLP